MAKLVLTALILLLIGFGVYYLFMGKTTSLSPVSNVGQQENIADADFSKTAPEDDLTAIEKDLLELEKTQMDFNSELDNL